MATLTYPYPDTLMVSVDLPDQPKALSEQPTLLEGVLRDILSVVSRFPDGLLAPSERNPVRNLVLDLATLQGETLRERLNVAPLPAEYPACGKNTPPLLVVQPISS